MTDFPSEDRDYYTLDDLAALDLTPADVRRLDPPPVERTALDGGPCWARADLADRLGGQFR
jgi:hypothetical protein